MLRNVPMDESAVVLVSHASKAAASTKTDACWLFHAIGRSLLLQGARVEKRLCWNQRGRGQACKGYCRQSSFQNHILVVVEDAKADFDTGIAQNFLAQANASILPVIEEGKRPTPSPAYKQHIAYFHKPGEVESAFPEVLHLARIGTEALNVFISYRHEDSAAIATQIFHALAEARFNVFLDRFRGSPSHDFVGVINAELFEKGFLLVLEGKDTHLSTWVQGEVAAARAHSMGIVKVKLPGSSEKLTVSPTIELQDTRPTVGEKDQLDPADIETIVSEFRKHFHVLSAKRQIALRQKLKLSVEIADRSLGFQDLGSQNGLHRVTSPSGREYGLAMSARPPRIGAFRQAAKDTAALAPNVTPVVVGPIQYQLPNDKMDTLWISTVSGVRTLNEGVSLINLLSLR